MNLEKHQFKSGSFIALINEAVDFMINTPMEPLPPDNRFPGGGVYALYYTGKFPQYEKIYQSNKDLPIYIGKAVLSGWRQGRGSTKINQPALYNRLKEHARSIAATSNLEVTDFKCKFLLLTDQEADLISTVEAAMTRRYNPLWNSYIDGFGNHDPGKGRYEQAKSEWDILHSGRVWADRLKGISADINKVEEKIGAYYVIKST
ncbi:MAG: Eco29kI family restriction endonuclease [Candidatus Oceanisphaera merdipullorum]|nr:Eco29kI family restriction endonuclease [Candidatus Oceanisphaera merdipullorum]